MSWSVQRSTWTSNNRYPGIFRTVQARIAEKTGPDLGQAGLKILSFGCSNGSELSTLRSYFPEALLYGCDINLSALRDASEALLMDEAVLFESSPENLRKYGPFDIILAMSIFCRFPESLSPERLQLRDLYSFTDFDHTSEILSENLRNGGLLCMYNTNYSFVQSRVAKNFCVVSSPLIASNGFVDKFDIGGDRVTWCEQRGSYYVHRVRRNPNLSKGFDFVNCVFEKTAGGGPNILVPVRQTVTSATAGPAHLFRFGPDLSALAAEGLVGFALGYWFDYGDFGCRITRAWHRSWPDGSIDHGEKWSVQADVASQTALATASVLPMSACPAPSGRAAPTSLTVRHVGRRVRAWLKTPNRTA